MRGQQLLRQWEILRALEECRLTRMELAHRCGVHVRTIYRDLDVLEGARFPLYSERGEDGFVRYHLLAPDSVPARRTA
jgi:predicted DNA-binding transcriptional regulator YafY